MLEAIFLKRETHFALHFNEPRFWLRRPRFGPSSVNLPILYLCEKLITSLGFHFSIYKIKIMSWKESVSCSGSHVQLFVTPWTVGHQASLSVGFSKQECWDGLPFPSPRDLPNPGIKPRSPTLWIGSLLTESQGYNVLPHIYYLNVWNLNDSFVYNKFFIKHVL